MTHGLNATGGRDAHSPMTSFYTARNRDGISSSEILKQMRVGPTEAPQQICSRYPEEGVLCQPIPIDEELGICEHSPLDQLLLVLAAVLVGQLQLQDSQMFALKVWLIRRADEFEESDFLEIGIKNRFANNNVDLVARVGKDENGEVAFWHLGLPWPNCWAA